MARRTSSTLSPIRSTGPTACSIVCFSRLTALFDVIDEDVGERWDSGLRDCLVVGDPAAFHVQRHGQVPWSYSLAYSMVGHFGSGFCDGVGAQDNDHMSDEVVSKFPVDRYWLRFSHGETSIPRPSEGDSRRPICSCRHRRP